jgi:polyisoprenoid-binding protein YceI
MRARNVGAIAVVVVAMLGAGAWTFVNGPVAPEASLEALAAVAATTKPPSSSRGYSYAVAPTTKPPSNNSSYSYAVAPTSVVAVPTPTTAPPSEISASSGIASPMDGTWIVSPGEGVFGGYRIEELAAGSTLKSTATGRSPAVSGQLEIVASLVTDATITVDMTKLASDSAGRDGFMRIAGLRTDEFPEATFALTTPFDLGAVPTGADVTVSVPGTLTLKGVGAPVTITFEARFDGSSLLVAGQAPIVLSDFAIDPPTNPFVSVESQGVMEFQLRFERIAQP